MPVVSEQSVDRHEWRWVIIASILLMLAISVPFMFAYAAAIPDYRFMGVLLNPIDGASYLAKMNQGAQGSWLFHLPYTPEPHRGAVMYTFYLGLGHLARVLNLPIILVFHAARFIGSLLMFLAIYQFVAHWTADVTQRRLTWGLAVVGGGFGWIAILAQYPTPDIWTLAEAFPLQAAYANAHFPWAIAVGIWTGHTLLNLASSTSEHWPGLNGESFGLAMSSIFLMSVSPFLSVVVGIGYAVVCALLWRRTQSFPRREIAWGLVPAIFALPVLAYTFWAISSANPELQQWAAQNQTPAGPVWEYLVGFGALLILAGVGLWGTRRSFQIADGFLIGWLVAVSILLYAPIGLQRRFTMAVTVPLSVYAGVALWRIIIPALMERLRLLSLIAILTVSSLSTVFAIALPIVGVRQPVLNTYYISAGEDEAINWLRRNGGDNPLVLASPDLSLFLPIWGMRVVYAHPYETIKAKDREAAVRAYYSGETCDVIANEHVQYVVIGPREKSLSSGNLPCPTGDELFRSADGAVAIYSAPNQ